MERRPLLPLNKPLVSRRSKMLLFWGFCVFVLISVGTAVVLI
ncbi:hypothetical protein PhaeoP10_01824 [Phaeobacter inhibens]|nr:hypothetical protein PhaeoP10_01824 [Phaeobacter inhibens]AUQ66384.1 hypothetical protein PhaeoP78_01517 [Phaeobacter inhibens]